jgi:SAM-dependent methyltransferase
VLEGLGTRVLEGLGTRVLEGLGECEHGGVEYDPTQYLGAAPYYLRGRPGYSVDLASSADELGLDGTGHLIDVGSGPGTVGVQLARLFGQVTLLEPDPGMLAEARERPRYGVRGSLRYRSGAATLPVRRSWRCSVSIWRRSDGASSSLTIAEMDTASLARCRASRNSPRS